MDALLMKNRPRSNPRLDTRMNEIGKELSERSYEINPALVAEEIIRRMRIVRSVRRSMADGAGRSRRWPDPGHPGR